MIKSSSKISEICANHPILCTVISALCWFSFCAAEMYHGAKEFYFIDTDCYTRYLRIIDWLTTDFSWYEKIFPFTNCPYGEILHFTRINDLLWLIFSLPFMAFFPLKEAIFAGGMIFSPILFILTLSLVMCGLKKYIGAKNFTKPSLFIFVFSFIFLLKSMVFNFGRPDHHSLMILITAFASLNLLNISKKNMFWSGIAAALGIWASSAFEGMLLAYIILAILVIGILFYKHSFDYAFYYSLGMFAGVAVSYALNPPYEGYLYFDNARLSLIHVAVCAFTFLVFAVCKYYNPEKLWQKISAISGGAIISFALLLSIFGVNSVFAPVYDEKITKYFIPYVAEMTPILAHECMYFIFGSIEAFLLYRCFNRKKFGDIALYTMFFLYLPVAIFIRRFMPYGILFFIFLNACMLAELFKKISKSEKYKWATLICISLNLVSALSFTYEVIPTKVSYPQLNGCALTDTFFAPQLIYKTGVKTISSPYHRNVDGITDTVEIFTLQDETQILNRLAQRNVKYIIIPNEQQGYKKEHLKKYKKNSFYRLLQDGHNYNWLKLLNDKDEIYLFYEVIR